MNSDRRIALVAGATGGVGSAIAAILAEKGVHVIVHGRDKSRAEALSSELNKNGGQASPVVGICDTEIGRKDLANKVLARFGGIDILVNSIGGGGAHETWWETTDQKWSAVYELNVMTTAGLIKHFVPGMMERKWGRVVNIASVSAIKPLAIGPEYAAAKAAILSLTVSLAKACAGQGVTANSICPGLVLTTGVRSYLEGEIGQDSEVTESQLDRFAGEGIFPNLVGQLARPEDIGRLVAFLSSDDGARITGQNLVVDGGFLHC